MAVFLSLLHSLLLVLWMTRGGTPTESSTRPGKVVNVVSPSCGTLEWDAPDASVGLTYKIRFYSSTPSSPEVVLSSPTNSLTFTGLDVPTQRPLDVTIKACRNGVHSSSWSMPVEAATMGCP